MAKWTHFIIEHIYVYLEYINCTYWLHKYITINMHIPNSTLNK